MVVVGIVGHSTRLPRRHANRWTPYGLALWAPLPSSPPAKVVIVIVRRLLQDVFCFVFDVLVLVLIYVVVILGHVRLARRRTT